MTSEAAAGLLPCGKFLHPDLELDFSQKNIKGFIVVGSTSEWSRWVTSCAASLTGGLPIVFVDSDPGEPGCDSVVTDHLAMERRCSTFWALGYQEIGYIGSQEYRGQQASLDLRVQYFRTYHPCGLRCKEHVFIANTVSMQVGYTLACQAARSEACRALFVAPQPSACYRQGAGRAGARGRPP